MKKIVIAAVIIVVIGIFLWSKDRAHKSANETMQQQTQTSTSAPIAVSSTPPTTTPSPSVFPQPTAADFVTPVSRANERTTKKFFGTKVSPQNSPVMPERFIGYHTGLDFETFSEEQDVDVVINAACAGTVKLKKTATGYGGVLVEACKLSGQDVTVVYGHLKISSIALSVGDVLKQGQVIGLLGKGFSSETDGERKHLHFGIHKGTMVNILGYVQKESELSGWINPEMYLS